MSKKNLVLYAVILVLFVLFLWQWLSKGNLINQLNNLAKENSQLHLLSGVGPLKSTHIHADVKVYINGKAIDFSQGKYQLASRFIHFEDGIGDVVHIHATGLTLGHLFKSLGMDFDNNCINFEGQNYCNNGNNKLRFYVNGQPNNEFSNYIMQDLDKILVSYGSDTDSDIQKQISSVTKLAANYSTKKVEME